MKNAKICNLPKITISYNNKKVGNLPTISWPAVITCPPGAKCIPDCYACSYCEYRPNVAASYENNLKALLKDPGAVWDEIYRACRNSKGFRYQVCGDIPNEQFLLSKIACANDNPQTIFLFFTKKYDLVNRYYEMFPANLQPIFSKWPGMDMPNPHNIPVAIVYYDESELQEEWITCRAQESDGEYQCIDCLLEGRGCWYAKKGDVIALKYHGKKKKS